MAKVIRICLLVNVCLFIQSCSSEQVEIEHKQDKRYSIIVNDFTDLPVKLEQPAQRIVAMAPHLVENVFSAGAGAALVGVVAHSDFPAAATELPIVGSYNTINSEVILALKPDLVLAWESGNTVGKIEALKELGLTVYIDKTKTLEDVAKAIQDIGKLAGTSDIAERESNRYLVALKQLRAKYQHREPISTFYQVWNSPIQTISANHIISATIELCGGVNIFANEPAISPTVNIESILDRNPQAIIASGMTNEHPDWLEDWREWESLAAVKHDGLFFVNPDHIQRHTTRLVLAAEKVCAQLDSLRKP